MKALANKDRAVLELISGKGPMSRAEILETISQKQLRYLTAKPGGEEIPPAADKASSDQIDELIRQRLLLTKSTASGDELLSVSEDGQKALSLLISFLHTRRAIGIVGMALPVVLLLGNVVSNAFFGTDYIPSSVSGYYYTGMRNVFVGAIFAIAVFLLSYRGYERDYIWTTIAGASAILVALFPTKPHVPVEELTSQEILVGNLHLVFAGTLFAALAFICFQLFTKTDLPEEQLKQSRYKGKRRKNLIYRLCGGVIVACLVLVPVGNLILGSTVAENIKLLYILEFVALLAFGFSWITKSDWHIWLLKFLQDEEKKA
jgi:hypothetical protein